jgi:replication factor C subunit 2/4
VCVQQAVKENTRIAENVLRRVIEVTKGDMRRAITLLQTSKRLSGEEEVTVQLVEETAVVIPEEHITALLDSCTKNSFRVMEEAVQHVIDMAFPVSTLLTQIHDQMMNNTTLTDTHKALIAIKLAEVDKNLLDGADEYLQALHLMSFIAMTIISK